MEAEASISSKDGGEPVPATTINVSGSGVYLRSERPTGLTVGDEVSCDLNVGKGSEDTLPSWGLGRVVRVDDKGTAVELTAAIFSGAETAPEGDDKD